MGMLPDVREQIRDKYIQELKSGKSVKDATKEVLSMALQEIQAVDMSQTEGMTPNDEAKLIMKDLHSTGRDTIQLKALKEEYNKE